MNSRNINMSHAQHYNLNLKNCSMFFLSFCLFVIIHLSFSKIHARSSLRSISTGIESGLILSGEFAKITEKTGFTEENLLDFSWEIRPHVDLEINDTIAVGGEINLFWFNTQDELWQGQRLSIAPAARIKMSFPLDCRWMIEGVFAGGFNTWGLARGISPDQGGARLWGVGMRLQLGLRYIVNTKVHLLFGGSFMNQQVYDSEEVYEVLSFPITLGIRGVF